MASKKSYILAGAVALGVTAWMLSDNIFGSAPTAEAEIEIAEDTTKKTPQFIVSAVRVENQPITQVVRANGFSEAEFVVTVSAKTSGEIVKIGSKEGSDVKKGDVLVQLDSGTLPEQIRAARANLEVAKKRQEVAARLAKENFSAPLEQVERAADYQNALVKLTLLQEQLANTSIASPVSGRLETLHVEAGERIRSDMPAATILGLDTLSVIVTVPQTDIATIKIGNIYEQSLKEIIDHGFSIKYFRNHSDLCLAGEDKDFISKFMTKSGQTIFKPALAKDIFSEEDFV